jgi:acyl-CoA synthetase (AMP-forming)/AMP-acid ligase II
LRFKRLPNEQAEFSEILVRSPFLMLGYLDDRSVVQVPDEEGFFPTGDLGFTDASGQLVLSGRVRDVIKKGGYFISLREIELLAQSHPAVAEAATAVVTHPFYGETYRIKLILKPGVASSAADDVRDFLYASMAKYKWPDGVDVVTDFPRTASGKIRKFLLGSSE